MNIQDLGSAGEFIAAIATLATSALIRVCEQDRISGGIRKTH